MRERPIGKLTTNGVVLQPHEYETVMYFLRCGKDIELIPESHTPKKPSPDFWMDCLVWESKSPTMNKIKTIERLFYKAVRQSSNVVFDLRRLDGSDAAIWRALEKCFKATRKARRMYIILKDEMLQEYSK